MNAEPEGSEGAQRPRLLRFALLMLALVCLTVIAALVQKALGPDDAWVWIPVTTCLVLALVFLRKRLLPSR
jgi:hypothetical protein